jgi:hypothetical protein
VEINAIMLALLAIPAEYTQEYNRWYDLDHLPEHVSKADVLMGRRYVATRELREAPGIQPAELTHGHPPYATIYSFGGPLDFMSDEAQGLWRDKDRGIVKSGRFWREGRAVYTSRWRVAAARARPSVLVAHEAIPYLAHRGIIVALGRAPSADRVHEAVDWWETTHLVDLFAVPGVLAAIRCRPVGSAEPDALLHILLCEDAPADVMERLTDARRYHQAVGRYPAHGGVYESIAFLPYESIVPLSYDFDVGPDGD